VLAAGATFARCRRIPHAWRPLDKLSVVPRVLFGVVFLAEKLALIN
jgi:hypothetical protein